jgi:acetyltransferase-like isoleucine patch superfamily enzyme
MCGIVGYVGPRPACDIVVDALRRMEYRGYDSAGIALLDGSGGLTIGDYNSISSGVQIYSHDTVAWAVTSGTADTDRAPVAIGDAVYIGAQTVIAKGVTIGEHAVIGACSFVNRDVAPYTVAAGVPCRPIGTVRVSDGGTIELEYAERR